MTEEEKTCSIIFDELCLQPHVDYNNQRDIIEGFLDDDIRKKLDVADHILVFIMKGILQQMEATSRICIL